MVHAKEKLIKAESPSATAEESPKHVPIVTPKPEESKLVLPQPRPFHFSRSAL